MLSRLVGALSRNLPFVVIGTRVGHKKERGLESTLFPGIQRYHFAKIKSFVNVTVFKLMFKSLNTLYKHFLDHHDYKHILDHLESKIQRFILKN